MASRNNISIVDEWLDEDKLMLLECWARDGYTYQDIALKIGITQDSLRRWRDDYPEIREALKNGREIVDYKVENALLKSALGYRTKEVRVTTEIKFGKVIGTTREVLTKDQTPNVAACQVWLYNRLPDKWKKNRDNLIELDEEDMSIQVTVQRADIKDNDTSKKQPPSQPTTADQLEDYDEEWVDEINTDIKIERVQSQDNQHKSKDNKKSKPEGNRKSQTKVTEDRDYWPDDWED